MYMVLGKNLRTSHFKSVQYQHSQIESNLTLAAQVPVDYLPKHP